MHELKSCPRCLVYLLDIFFSQFPLKVKEMDVLYLRPKPRVCGDDSHWYEYAAVGNAKLCTLSLRATGASALFNAGVPERLIRDVTGHKSNALHLYEHPTEQQKKQQSWYKGRNLVKRMCLLLQMQSSKYSSWCL